MAHKSARKLAPPRDPDFLNPQLCRSGAVLSAEAGRSDAPIYRAGRDVLAIREAGG